MASRKKRTRQPRSGLTAQEQAWCQRYVLSKNGAEAVAATWPHTRKWKPQSRAERATKLLRRAHIRARVAELEAIARAKLNTAFAMTAEQVIGRLTLLACGTVEDFVQLDEQGQPTIALKGATAEQLYCVESLTIDDIDTGRRQGKRTRLKLADRTAALRLLGQHHQLFSERVEHQHQHHLLIEHAARDLDNKLALLISRRTEERSESVEDAEAIEVQAT